MDFEFAWDPAKAAINRKRHRVSFEEAATAFYDPLSLTIPDPDHSAGEARYLLIGRASSGRLLVVSHLDEAETRIRIISAREPTRHERRHYEEDSE